MRISALLLLSLNLVYLAWHLQFSEDGAREPLVRSPGRQAPQTLTLLRESRRGSVDADMPDGRCYRVGVFSGTDEGDAFVSRLKALGYEATVALEEVPDEPDYWVHIPPFASGAAARRRLEELQAENIDSYIIRGGPLAGGISLGLFGRRELALRLQEDLASRGVSSSIREVPRTLSQIWVEVADLPAGGFPQEQWAALQENYPGLRQREKLCETIAPSL